MCGQYEVTFCSFYTFKVGITFFIFPHHLYSLRLELRYLQCLIVNRCGNIMRYVSKDFFFFFFAIGAYNYENEEVTKSISLVESAK